jgi:hypothetical protein
MKPCINQGADPRTLGAWHDAMKNGGVRAAKRSHDRPLPVALIFQA